MSSIYDIANTDTICAVATAPGRGGIAVVRVSGPNALECVATLWRGRNLADVSSHTVHYGRLIDGEEVLDDAVATVFREPRSFTGDDVVELSVHGSPYIQRRLLQLLTASGARLALPGEFTRRAFLAGKMDLAQAEAVADVIASTTAGAHRLATSQLKGGLSAKIDRLRNRLIELASLLELELDFSEEDVQFASRSNLIDLCNEIEHILQALADSFATGQAIVNGLPVVIAGVPNAGKSTLLNRLLNDERAIVSDIPGTTRDVIEDTAEIDGILFRFIDTAGLRGATNDLIEQKGIDRAMAKLDSASLVLYLYDSSPDANTEPQSEAFARIVSGLNGSDTTVIPVLNRTDIATPMHLTDSLQQLQQLIENHNESLRFASIIMHSADSEQALIELKKELVKEASNYVVNAKEADVVLTNARHHEAIVEALNHLLLTRQTLLDGTTPDLVAQHLRAAISSLGAITGAIATPDLLTTIFSRFCIGK